MNVSKLFSPFHHYNLYRNPFGELTRAERAEVACVDVTPWLSLLQNDRFVLQFIGRCGRGKTTHALALQKALALQRAVSGVEYIYLPEQKPRPRVGLHRPMIVDESQRLTFWQLRRVLQVPGPLILATHVNHHRAIERAQRDVLTVEVGGDITPRKLQEIFNRRLEASRLREGTIPQITPAQATRLYERFGNDIRAIENHLYVEFQHSVLKQAPWPTAT